VAVKPFLDQSEAEWDQVVDVNLKGVWLVTQETARHMARHGHGGSIVNIASLLAYAVEPQVAAYCASKAGVVQLTRVSAVALARHKIRVNALAPGYFPSSMTREFLATERAAAMIQRIPQRRIGGEGDLDGPLLLLASDASAYMTGSVVVVDGGHSLA
jgi:NAD(P)-dependent dehydrogenase (short-subunit alcohol dehydrogenase family)